MRFTRSTRSTRTPRRVGALLAAAMLSATLGACGSGSGANGAGGDKPYIAIVSKGFQHQFWQAVKKGAEEQAEKSGARITFEGPATESDIEEQVTMLTNALAKQPDAIGLAALDSRAAAPLMQQAEQRGIPVVAFDSGVDSDVPVTTVATDNKAAAAEAAKRMAERIGGKGTVALVVHDQTSRSGIDRRDGFMEWMKKNAPGIEVLAPQYGGGDPGKSANITKSIIASHPGVDGVYGSNEGSAIGVIKGVQESGKKDVTVVGFDSGQAQINAVRNGDMAGAITQNPVEIGRKVVASAMKTVDGKKLPKVIDTGYYWYDKRNIDEPEIQAALYE